MHFYCKLCVKVTGPSACPEMNTQLVCLLQPRLPAKQGHPCENTYSSYLWRNASLAHPNNSHGRIWLTTEWWHGEETPQTNSTGQNIPAEKEATVKTNGVDSTSWTFTESDTHTFSTLGHSRKQGPRLINLHPKHIGSAGPSALSAEKWCGQILHHWFFNWYINNKMVKIHLRNLI